MAQLFAILLLVIFTPGCSGDAFTSSDLSAADPVAGAAGAAGTSGHGLGAGASGAPSSGGHGGATAGSSGHAGTTAAGAGGAGSAGSAGQAGGSPEGGASSEGGQAGAPPSQGGSSGSDAGGSAGAPATAECPLPASYSMAGSSLSIAFGRGLSTIPGLWIVAFDESGLASSEGWQKGSGPGAFSCQGSWLGCHYEGTCLFHAPGPSNDPDVQAGTITVAMGADLTDHHASGKAVVTFDTNGLKTNDLWYFEAQK